MGLMFREPGNPEAGVWLEKTTYLGGHHCHPDPIRHGAVAIDSDGVSIYRRSGDEPALTFAPSEIVALTVDGPREVRSRVTLARVLTLGLIALAIPKRDGLSYLIVQTADGEAIVEVPSVSVMDLRALVQPFVAKDSAALPPPAEARSARERLRELKDLMEEDLITHDQYELRRKEILGEL